MIFNNLLNTYSDIVIPVGIFVFVLGAAMGSFLNVVVDRTIHGQSLMGRSHCDHCKKTLRWYELIPIISYIIVRGKCVRCHTHFSIQYLIVEIVTGFLYVGTWMIVPMGSLILYWGIVSCAWIIFLSDVRYSLISDYSQLSLGILIIVQKIIERASIFSLLTDAASGVMVALPIGLIYVITNERAMGAGDVILAFIIGFALGIWRGLLGIYIAFLLGAVVGVILLIGHKKKMKSAVPFGPFLLLGMLIAAVFGDILIQIIKKQYGL